MVLVLSGGCADSDDTDTTQVGSEDPAASSNSYSSEVDGISVSWPEGWHRVEAPLDGGRLTNSVELVALATFDDAAAGQCAPAPDAAMEAMEQDDVLFTLRTSDGPGDPAAGDPATPRPQSFMDAAEPHPDSVIRPGEAPVEGCFPEGVEAWRLIFQQHGRHYEAFVAGRSPVSDERRAEVEQIWSSLDLTPIATGQDDAEIGRPYWHSLYTHCGIKATTFDGRGWVADPEVSDGQGNPPRAWGNPNQPGTIVLEDEDTAVFTSRDGERSATFRPRASQDPPLQPCQ